MKKLLIAVALLFTLSAQAQTASITKDASGNYHQTATTKAGTGAKESKTGHTFTDKTGKVYDLFIGAKGGIYYYKEKKDGTTYKCYLPK